MKAGKIKGAAHITGGGLIENPPRCHRRSSVRVFDWDAWPMPPCSVAGRDRGIAEHEMRRTFNCGVGFILVVAPENVEDVLAALLEAGETAFVCGQLV
jgi:phosphoribosylformylglycinamidine cyclo-ligase